MSKKLAIAMVTLVLLPGLAAAQAAQAAQAPRKDLQVFKDASEQVLRYVHYTVFDDVSIDVANGAVTLTGRVTMPYKVQDIERVVSKVPGVTSMKNELTVLPVSFFDDDLRYGIARAIYGDPSFARYAIMANPPIHIVVENGRVRLTGVVNSEVERTLAQSRATWSGAFSVVNELKTDAEVTAELEKLGRG
jgi:hyperosmotically inducible periplasmic protein